MAVDNRHARRPAQPSGRTVLAALLLVAAATASAAAQETGAPPAKGMFGQFVGVCQAGAEDREIW